MFDRVICPQQDNGRVLQLNILFSIMYPKIKFMAKINLTNAVCLVNSFYLFIFLARLYEVQGELL